VLGFNRRTTGANGASRRRQRGGAAVEFAIVLPLFCAVVFGTIDYGWYFYQRFTLAAAIRDGIRYGVTVPYASDPWTTAQTRAIADLASGAISSSSVTWGPSIKYSGAAPTQLVTLSGTLTFRPLVGFVPLPSTMSYSMTMLLELQ
jgi:Flp pilus assembly protein TadG